ncbi:YitT family protein [uncultured Selenomonas sp.]|uniref:YitT family protein n=1 Tax=uncultured Selenomonas sp. TaxID=159275 RepID=UPI0028D4943D|nr:YitT family protein [uncultured Selenomonas sp.]
MTAETAVQQEKTAAAHPHAKEKPKRGAGFYLKKCLWLILGALITAVGLELFLIPNNVIDGGVVGLSIMSQTITGMGLGVFLVLYNIPFVYMGYKQIGKSFAGSTVFAILMLSVWSGALHGVPQVTNDPFLAAIFGGVVTGLGVGIVMRTGGCFDGTEIVAIIMDARTQFSVGEIVMFINLFILSSAGLLYGWDKAMYSLFAYFVIAKMIDVVLKGLDESYAVMIVTNEHEELTAALNERLGRGVTLLHGAGGYTGEAKEVLYCVVTRLELEKLKEIVLDKDERAFVTINAVHDIVGGRFKKKAIH